MSQAVEEPTTATAAVEEKKVAAPVEGVGEVVEVGEVEKKLEITEEVMDLILSTDSFKMF